MAPLRFLAIFLALWTTYVFAGPTTTSYPNLKLIEDAVTVLLKESSCIENATESCEGLVDRLKGCINKVPTSSKLKFAQNLVICLRDEVKCRKPNALSDFLTCTEKALARPDTVSMRSLLIWG